MELSVRQVTSGGGDKQSEFLPGFPCDEEQKRDRNKLQINRKPKRYRRFFRRLFGCCWIEKSNGSKQRKKIEEYGRENSFGENFVQVPTEGEVIFNESNSKSEESKENCDLVKIPTHNNINVDADVRERNSAEVPQKVVHEGLETIPKLELMESEKVMENKEAYLSKEILPFDHQKDITETEKNWLQTGLKQLPIPFFWLSEYYKSEKASACAREGNCDTTVGWLNGKTLRQDHFQTVAYRLWLSARYCLDMLDYKIALKELAQGKRFALEHFSEAMQKIDGKGDSSLEAKMGDQDVEKSPNLMINGSLAFISYQMTNYRDAEQLLQAMRKINNQVSTVKGIQATILAYSETAIEVSVKFAQETAMMDPTYWRWHALTSLLTQHLPEPDNVSQKINRREMILAEMETVFHLEKNNTKSALLLGDAYRNAVFQVRGQNDTYENYEEYAKQAVDAYVAAIERAPNCSIMHALAARSFLFISEDDLKTNDNSEKGVKVISGEQMKCMEEKDEVIKVSLIKMMRENEKEHLKGTEQLVDLAADPDLKVNEDSKNTNILINSEQIPNILETNDGLNDKEECDIGHRNESDNDILVQVEVNNIGRGKPDGIEGNDPLDKPLLGSENVMKV